MQGLTTGGLPTFIDVGSSFGSYTITEDNLLFQLLSVGRRLEMMGDDTWLDVFPSAFNRSTPFPSLVVKDIHTVDDGVLANIFPALNRDDWDLLIGHFLGVDHVGHTFAVDSPIMDTKLDQMNQMMLDVVAAMKAQAHRGGRHERSLLLFMSDHGQTLTGDHGGGTPEEAHAFLLAVSMQPPPHPLPAFLSACPSPEQAGEKDMAQRAGGGEKECFEELPQIDFTPTLSVLLGAPIPFASVGKVNPHMLALSPAAWEPLQPPAPTCNHTELNLKNRTEEGSKIDPAVRFLSRLSSALMMNAWQVRRAWEYGVGVWRGVAEGHVAAFLLATSALLHLRQSLVAGSWRGVVQASSLLLVNALLIALGLSASHKLSNQAAASADATAATAADAATASASAEAASASASDAATPAASPGPAALGALSSSQFLHALPSILLSYAPLLLVPLLLHTLSTSLLSALRRSPPFTQPSTTKATQTSNHQPAIDKLGQVFFSLAALVPQLGMWVGYVLLAFLWLLHDSPSSLSFLSGYSLLQQPQQQQQQQQQQQRQAYLRSMVPVSSLQEAIQLGIPRLVFASSLLFLALTLLMLATGFFCRFLSKILLIRASPAAPVAGGSKHEGSGKSRKKKKDGVVQTAEKAPEFEQQHNGLVSMPQQLPGYGVRQQQQAQEQKLGRTLIHLIGLFGVPIILVGGRSIPVILLLGALQGMLFLSLSHSHASVPSFILCCVEWSLLSFLLFFASGHACTFDGLRYTAAFTGFNDFQYHRQGGLLALDTFGFSHLIPALAIPLLALLAHPRTLDSLTQISMKAFLLFLFPRVMATFTTTAFVAGMRRHLMVIKQQH
ncbi:unnamed protein product [Closterium sp. NIES-64]|nr:unnamed protein product [Closterium sp. NIES-64]